MKRKLCVIPGDGIGPEVTNQAVEVMTCVIPDLKIVPARAGWQLFEETGNSVPRETFQAIRDCGAGLFGAVSSPSFSVEGYRSAILQIRQQLDLFANIRPVCSRWSNHPKRDVNLVIVRENTEGLYSGIERTEGDCAITQRVISRSASIRIGQTSVQIAENYGFDRIHIVHKANVMPVGDGLFRDSVREAIEASAKQLRLDEALVDVAAFRLVDSPEEFQVIVTTNMFGDILSDLAAYWCGGMGRAPSLNLGDHVAVAEPVHGSAPDIAGQGIADPTAALLSAALLCRLHWRDLRAAREIEEIAENHSMTKAT